MPGCLYNAIPQVGAILVGAQSRCKVDDIPPDFERAWATVVIGPAANRPGFRIAAPGPEIGDGDCPERGPIVDTMEPTEGDKPGRNLDDNGCPIVIAGRRGQLI